MYVCVIPKKMKKPLSNIFVHVNNKLKINKLIITSLNNNKIFGETFFEKFMLERFIRNRQNQD